MKKSTDKTEKEVKLYETENDIPQPRRTALIVLMNQRLADAVDLQLANETGALERERLRTLSGCTNSSTRLPSRPWNPYVDLIAERIVQQRRYRGGHRARVAAARFAPRRISARHRRSAAHTWKRSPRRCPRSGMTPAIQSTRRRTWATRTRRIFFYPGNFARCSIDKWLWFVEAHSQADK